MNSPLPLSNLHRITLLMTTFINLFVMVILIISQTATVTILINILLRSFVAIYLLGLANIFIIHFVQTHYTKSANKADRLRYVLSSLLSFVIFAVLTILFAYLDGKQEDLDRNQILPRLIAYVIFHTLIVVLHDQVILQQSKTQAELENMQLKAAISEASNFLLRQQIHPHFLFNSLTILKSLYKKDTAKGEFYLTRLASFLRASVSDHSSRVTSLQTELNMCMDYMDMQKIRFGTAIDYTVQVSEEALTRFVPFFSIQVLLENSIKHNALTEANPLTINISDSGNYLTVENSLQIKAHKEISTGQGLSNLAERYRLLSGDQISIKQDQEHFSVTIKMYENENCDH